MNLADNIVRTLRNQPMTLPVLHQVMNDVADYPWPGEFFAAQIEKLLLIGRIVKDGDKYSVPGSTREQE